MMFINLGFVLNTICYAAVSFSLVYVLPANNKGETFNIYSILQPATSLLLGSSHIFGLNIQSVLRTHTVELFG